MSCDRFLMFPAAKAPKGAKPILWPVYVAKVLYPAPGRRSLNVFQEMVLGLARARCCDPVEVANLLCLTPELVKYVQDQLKVSKFIDDRGVPTPGGLDALFSLDDVQDELRVGYAFQDAIGGAWLPRFEESLPEIEPAGYEGGCPVFIRSRETAERERPLVIDHKQPPRTEPSELLKACSDYKTDHFHARQRDDWEDLPGRLDMSDLSFLDDEPQPMWIWTWIYKGRPGSPPWLVADPFGMQGAAIWLRKPLEQLLPTSEGLARFIARLAGNSQVDASNAAEWLAGLEDAADLTVLADYPFTGKVPRVQDRLAATLRKMALVEGHGTPHPEDVRSLLIESQSLVETVLQWLLNVFPLRNAQHGGAWEESAKQILFGLGVPYLDDTTAIQLSRQRWRDIYYALDRGTSSLKALLTAALLTTARHRSHPLLVLSGSEVNLGGLLELADTRNRQAGHAGSRDAVRQDALKHAETALNWVKIFKDWY